MYCIQCGEYIEEGNAFCTKCGARANAAANAPSQGTPPAAAPTATQAMPAGMTMPASDLGTTGAWPAAQPQSAPGAQSAWNAGGQQTAAVSPGTQKGKVPKAAIIAIAVVAALAVAGIVFALTHSGGNHGGETSTYTIESQDQQDTDESSTSGGDANSSSTTTDSDSTSNTDDSETDAAADQAQREDEARQAALDAGKEVFTGQVIVTTMAQRAHERASDLHDFDNHDEPYVVLQMDSTIQVEANSGDGQGMRTGDCDAIALPLGQFDAYDGQTITIAALPTDLWFYSDVTGVLAQIHANNAELIAPLDGSAPAPSSSASADSADSGDYVLADSDSRYYTREELEALDDLTLYHARNEIFARHGRQFNNPDLQEFFGSKPWYSGTVAPSDFNEQVLNEYEDANAKLMLAIEQERNSPYLPK